MVIEILGGLAQFGVKDMKFFHTLIIIQRRKNKIKVLKNVDGEWIYDDESLKNMAIDYYSELFASNDSSGGHFISGDWSPPSN